MLAYLAGRLGQLDRYAYVLDDPFGRMLDLLQHSTVADVRVGEDLSDGEHGIARDIGLGENAYPLVASLGQKRLAQEREHLFAHALVARQPVLMPLIFVNEVLPAQLPAEIRPELGFQSRERHVPAVGGPEHVEPR